MLTADQIEALSQRAEQISDSLSDFLIGDIAERISEAGQLTGTASYEVWRLQDLGVSQDKLKKELKKRLNISLSEVEDLLKQSAEAGYNFDISRFPTSDAIPFAENTSLQQIVNTAVQMAQEDFSNIVQTIGFVTPDGNVQELTQAYQQACDYAFQKTVTGTQDMYSAIREATRNLAEKGIRFIDYESGVHTSMEAAVRRCVMGGMGLMQEKISQDNHDYLGCDGWEISAHHGCAPDHEPIQGKQYDDKTYQNINGSLRRRIGTLNCGHAAFPIILGVNSPQYSAAELEEMRKENEEGVTFEGRHYTLYDATQRQRSFERSIRKQKRRILIDEKTGDTEKLQADQIRLVRLRQEYARFSKGTGLRQQWERAETAGFTWKHGNAAEKSAKETQQRLFIGKAKKPKNKGPLSNRTSAEGPNRAIGATWDNSRGSKSWKSDKYEQLVFTERTSVQSPVEVGTLFNADGKRIFRLEGDAGNVNFTAAQIKQMRDGILTHNHPGADYGCFSPDDINMLRRARLCEIRCATPIGVFSIQSPATWPTRINTFDRIENAYYDIYEQIGKDYYAKAMRGEISVLDAENLSQRAAVEELCKRHKIPFHFESWDDLAKG